MGANLYSKVGLFKPLSPQNKKDIYNALEIVDMADNKNSLIGNLSGGQQQRVFIARALVNQPKILFLDEPTVGVDAKAEDAVYCLLAKLNKEYGITVIMVTHDIGAVTVHANKIGCMGNKTITIHDAKSGLADNITNLYGYGVNLHVHKHICENCTKRGNNNA